jgi:hypothetical protein
MKPYMKKVGEMQPLHDNLPRRSMLQLPFRVLDTLHNSRTSSASAAAFHSELLKEWIHFFVLYDRGSMHASSSTQASLIDASPSKRITMHVTCPATTS